MQSALMALQPPPPARPPHHTPRTHRRRGLLTMRLRPSSAEVAAMEGTWGTSRAGGVGERWERSERRAHGLRGGAGVAPRNHLEQHRSKQAGGLQQLQVDVHVEGDLRGSWGGGGSDSMCASERVSNGVQSRRAQRRTKQRSRRAGRQTTGLRRKTCPHAPAAAARLLPARASSPGSGAAGCPAREREPMLNENARQPGAAQEGGMCVAPPARHPTPAPHTAHRTARTWANSSLTRPVPYKSCRH